MYIEPYHMWNAKSFAMSCGIARYVRSWLRNLGDHTVPCCATVSH